MKKNISIYIHVPYCLKKCGYCDFHSIAADEANVPSKAYAEAVCMELVRQIKAYSLEDREVETVYFGGGTPTLLSADNLHKIWKSICSSFSVKKEAEVTVEANPETLKHGNVEALKCFATRLSMGIQTFNDVLLRKLGRIHSAQTANDAVLLAQQKGFKNISIDLMWGLPKQTLLQVEEDLRQTLGLDVRHISAYQLTTDRHDWQSELPDEELSREMFFKVHELFTGSGFEHYEISNFAKPGFRSRHNENYWRYGEWLGLGSGATSSLKLNNETLKRWNCSADIGKYLTKEFTYEEENLTANDISAERRFLALRTADGIPVSEFMCEDWIKNGWAQIENGRFKLTLEGWLISDELFQAFV